MLLERHEISSPEFGILRQSLRQIVLKLRDSDEGEALELSARLRTSLSEWLTTPVTFDRSLANTLRELFGTPQIVQSRWGADIRTLYGTAFRVAEGLTSIENPVRDKLREVIDGMRSQGRSFKIYCHRRARPYFESLPDLSLSEGTFLHPETHGPYGDREARS
ncbi:hypothetical protein BH20ACI3_BH20ACI3_39650 [soil metagenome]